MSQAQRHATYEDLLAVPDQKLAQIVEGVLHVHPRPGSPHARAVSLMGIDIGGPFDRGRGGPGGWLILDEPELHLGSDIVVPDIAGWRRERMPEMPEAPHFTMPPDWACEVLSPSTSKLDRGPKRRIYAREHVSYLWLVDPAAKTLEAFRIEGDSYLLIATHEDDDRVRVAPFDAVELELAAWWSR
jgi:Uma2 family endonuclease